MPTTDTDVGRAGYTHPDLNHDGGALLHGKVRTGWTEWSDNALGRFATFSSVADSAVSAIAHNFGSKLANLKVNIYSGSGATKALVTDPVAAGWAIAETGGNSLTSIDVTAPSSGGPHDFVVVITDNMAATEQPYHLLAALPSGTPEAGSVALHWNTDKRGLAKDSSGAYSTLQTLNPVHVSGNFNAAPGNMYIVDTSGGPVTATLPATIQDYDVIGFADAQKSFNANNLTLDRNSNNVDGEASDFVFNTAGDGAVLVGDNTNTNWVKASSGAGGSGSGSGFTNYFTNGSFENDVVEGVTTGGGTAPTVSAEEASPLFGVRSAKVTSGAGTGYVDFAISGIDNAVIDGGIMLGLTAYLKTGAAVPDDDFIVGIHDGTSYIASVPQTNLKGDQLTVFRGVMVPVSGTTYTLRVEFTDTTAGRAVDVDGLLLTPDSSTSLSENITGFDYSDTFTNLFDGDVSPPTYGTILENFVRWKRIGNEMFAIFGYQQTSAGANGSGGYFITVPDGLTIDTSIQGGNHCTIGNYMYTDDINGHERNINCRVVYEQETSPQKIRFRYSSSVDDSQQWNSGNTPTFFDTNLRIGGWFRIPILEWKNEKVNLITPNLLKSNARVHYRVVNTSTPNGSKLTWDTTPLYNEGGFSLQTSDTEIVFPEDGTYAMVFNSAMNFAGTPSTASAGLFWLNGSDIYYSAQPQSDQAAGQRLPFSATAKVSKGDVFYLQNNTDQTISALGPTETFVSITRVADVGAWEPVGFGVATDTVYGLNLKNRVQIKNLTTDVSSVGNVAAWQFNNLVIGRTYQMFLHAFGRLLADDARLEARIFHDGAVYLRVQLDDNSSSNLANIDVPMSGFTRPFVATATTTTVNVQIAGSAELVGGDPESKLMLVELNDTEVTTDFT